LSATAIAEQGQDKRLLLPIAEVSALTGVSVGTLKRHAPCQRIGKLWLVPRFWVESKTASPEGDAA
jgi:hypothetical protein